MKTIKAYRLTWPVVHKLGYDFEDGHFLTKCETRGEKYLDPRVAKDWSSVTCKLCKRTGKDYQLWLKNNYKGDKK
jgi:hypothetical protein